MMHRRSAMAGAGRFDIEAIKRRLPHRYPFLMVDRIEESGPGYAIGIKNVTANEPCFQGHFPQRSVLPGALIAEALMRPRRSWADPPGRTAPVTPCRAPTEPRPTGSSSPSA